MVLLEIKIEKNKENNESKNEMGKQAEKRRISDERRPKIPEFYSRKIIIYLAQRFRAT